MNKVGQIERITQNRVVKLFKDELKYDYLGNWEYRESNSNIEEDLLASFLAGRGYTQVQIDKAIYALKSTASNSNDNLYTTNKNVYKLLRYGKSVQAAAGENNKTVHFFDWETIENNHFAIAEEVTVKGNHNKRPDIVIYVNGIALGVIELKRSTVSIEEGIRQNITNQQDHFIQPFFSTIQYLFAGNDTEGLRYGTIETQAKYYLTWKEDVEDNSRILLDKYILKMCDKKRFMEIIYNFVLFDGGDKKLPRVHQYFGIKESQKYVKRYEGGIIWHTQGSGKSIVMVMLAKWILENNPHARIVILTDRDELDKQIERVFTDVGEDIYRTRSGKDLMVQLAQTTPRLLCSLIHKFGDRSDSLSDKEFDDFIKGLESQQSQAIGQIFVFVDECHRTQSGRLHRTMKAKLPNAVFIGFTGTPLLKQDKKTSMEVFGKYIHTYKFNEGVEDGVILDLMYEARDIDQHLVGQKKVDQWFAAKTKGLNDFQKSEIKKVWGTMQQVLSSRSRMGQVVSDIVLDFEVKARLNSDVGNAILVAGSIYEACRYYELFEKTPLKDKVAVVTSYSPNPSDVVTEDIGENTATAKEFTYNLYTELLKDLPAESGKSKTESYEDWAKEKFIKEPANMKLLIVVSKLLTGFDVPSCTYLYLDKSMQDHGLFQAICRVNRLDTDDKEFGYIVDYKDLFKKVENAISVYTSELDSDEFGNEEIAILLKDRLESGRERLDDALEEIAMLCEPVEPPKDTLAYIRYFCGNTEIEEELKERETMRVSLYKKTVALIRAYANIADDMEAAGYSEKDIASIKKELDYYLKIREEIRKASGESLDLKAYEADMRHLLDTYIQADDSVVISSFGDLTLLEIIENTGIADAIKDLPDGIKGDEKAVAETIENSVRVKIMREHMINPAFFDEMSELLSEIIKARKTNAIAYKEYLKRIADLIRKVNTGKGDDTPDSLKTVAQRALYDNLNENEELALKLDKAVKLAKPDSWRSTVAKQKVVKHAIYEQLLGLSLKQQGKSTHDSALSYHENINEEVERIYNIVFEQTEY